MALSQDSFSKAETLLLQAFKKWEALGNVQNLYFSTSFLAELYEKQSDFESALKISKTVQRIRR